MVKFVVFDLDETLVHTHLGPNEQCTTVFRPGLGQLLSQLKSAPVHVAIYTAAQASYANPIIDHIQTMHDFIFDTRLYSNNLVTTRDMRRVKDIGKYFPANDSVLIDDNPVHALLHPTRTYLISPFYGNEHDSELNRVSSFLSRLI